LCPPRPEEDRSDVHPHRDRPDPRRRRGRPGERPGPGLHRRAPRRPTEVELRTGRHTITVDEPPSLGGQDVAASPVNLALVALASCQAITYRFWAEHLGIALDDVDVEVDADIDLRGFFGFDDDVRPGFGDIRVTVTPRGPESPERYEALTRAVDEHCPVLDLFANATPVTTTVALAAA
jgi:uncharacterized OsmC-like protein